MQAITTYYMGPTDRMGSRVKAKAQAGAVTLSWDDALNADANHMCAAKALVSKFGWNYGQYVAGHLSCGSTVWVCVDSHGMTPRFGAIKP